MKTLVKTLFVALSVSLTASAFSPREAKSPDRPAVGVAYQSGIYASANGRLNIAVEKQTGGSLAISLKTANGSVLYTTYVGKNDRSYRTRLNLNELEDGVYQLEISNGVDVTRQTVTISTKQPTTPQRVILNEAVVSAN